MCSSDLSAIPLFCARATRSDHSPPGPPTVPRSAPSWSSDPRQPDMPVPYVNLSYIYAQTWNIKGGIMYRIFKSAPRYAFKQLKYDGILEKKIDPSRIVTGKEAIEIFNKCKIKYGNQNK